MNQLNSQSTSVMQKVTVRTAARLHMGFFDLNGSAGRLFGSLGLCLDTPQTIIEIEKSEKTLIVAKNHQNVVKVADNLLKSLQLNQQFSLKILQAIPEHAGLGSGTQLALAIGAGLNRLFNLNLTVTQIAAASARGSRSGIGIGTFEQGGFVIDGGRGKKDYPPPIIARHYFPEHWPILLIFDHAKQGAHGQQELKAFNALPKATLASAQQLSHAILMQALPALVEQDYAQFSLAIQTLQTATGEYFAPAQGGHFASLHVAKILHYLSENKVICSGQSSWGPTGFAIFDSELSATNMLQKCQQQFTHLDNISFQIVHANNVGASIELA